MGREKRNHLTFVADVENQLHLQSNFFPIVVVVVVALVVVVVVE